MNLEVQKDIEKFEKLAESQGINLYKVESSRFKTNTLAIYLRDKLEKEKVSLNALLPAVLRMGSKDYPTLKEVNSQLEKLYGAVFDCGIQKKGENHVMYYYIEFVDDKYAGENIFEKAFDFLFSMVFEPNIINNKFDDDVVEREKLNVIDIIKNRINDKGQYAYERCVETMCENEPFGIYEYGDEASIKKISSNELFLYYEKMKKESCIDIFVYGNSSENEIEYIKQKTNKIERNPNINTAKIKVEKICNDIKESGDVFDIKQGKLSMGFRTQITPQDNKYYALMIMNSILGGGIHSKLFRNVREKEGLCYYSYSNLERYKGLMIISTGIDFDKKQKVIDLILKQLESIRNGEISEFEINSSVKSIKNSLNSLKDAQMRLLDFYYGQVLAGINDNLDDISTKCSNVKLEDVIDVSKGICLDTIYFLGPSENN